MCALFSTYMYNELGRENTMKFGYFDDANKEYVITTPKTPLPWINYLGCRKRNEMVVKPFLYSDGLRRHKM